MANGTNKLRLVRLGIDTLHEFKIYIRKDCFVCKSEGFETETQVLASVNGHSIIATLNVIQSDILQIDEASLSESAWNYLGIKEGDYVTLSHAPQVTSLKYVRSKIYGNTLGQDDFYEIIHDIVQGKYSNIHLSSFITACARDNLNLDEIIYLTHAMIKTGDQLTWDYPSIMDKHSVGGIPGNRTTPIVVAIVASAGLIIPKSSSRAITSPAGTADTVETMTPVTLSTAQIRQVVDSEGGCMVWGGSLGLSPADDIIIRVERSLDIDPDGQMIASVLSKKAAMGATDVVIDIPVGPTAKVRSDELFIKLEKYFIFIGKAVGLNVYVLKSDGIQPLGKGIGPALEAKDILSILRNENHNLSELKNKSLKLAAILLEAGKKATPGEGFNLAKKILDDGSAYKKFLAICEAQGGFREPPSAAYTHDIIATHSGNVIEIDNRNLSLVAKLAGAPHDAAAGIEFFAKQGTYIEKGQTLYRVHADSKGELNYALNFAKTMPDIVKISRGAK
ncbi:MAG: thymidine phosphorylase family protein [Gammaproteobacteria bacterium]|nr:thymidine phosphorylase family protein [Gammaproteobacteria bacterium]